MSTEMWIIAAVRLLGALPVLRWPFYGGLVAILVDQSDLFIMNLVSLGGVEDYQSFDKYLDQAYLLCFLVVALRWRGPARAVAVALYVYRLAGFAAFEVSGERDLLLFFPNFFEFWFLLMAALHQFKVEPFAPSEVTPAARSATAGPSVAGATLTSRRISPPAFCALLGALIALKMLQEYALHYERWLDSFTAVEAVEAIWRFLTPPY